MILTNYGGRLSGRTMQQIREIADILDAGELTPP
jgi:hypothetical protein